MGQEREVDIFRQGKRGSDEAYRRGEEGGDTALQGSGRDEPGATVEYHHEPGDPHHAPGDNRGLDKGKRGLPGADGWRCGPEEAVHPGPRPQRKEPRYLNDLSPLSLSPSRGER